MKVGRLPKSICKGSESRRAETQAPNPQPPKTKHDMWVDSQSRLHRVVPGSVIRYDLGEFVAWIDVLVIGGSEQALPTSGAGVG